ncbi:MAG: 2-amino-4-hydroxy-6-hydroxymethyldihydropteridine diphosphokinase [Puniceicoccales bacterium]|jgi:2-amino-4-hydroxy-6-hydroxymethyldihydropteridine diphosphokinase|nr:2-amino-4-hydroxy-6-hydroxymethyldihydropteridine diphosphokinase [Puniceicoccales bacterium]
MENSAYLSLGSNLGNRTKLLEAAIFELAGDNLRMEKFSSIYETEPQNFENQPNFLNCVVLVKTSLNPFELLAFCQGIERKLHKNKRTAFGPRRIDIDILTFNNAEVSTPTLTLPHPRIFERNFVLTPLKEIAPEFEIPGQHMDDLLQKCAGQGVSLFLPRNFLKIKNPGE